jgi:hypothetical protein
MEFQRDPAMLDKYRSRQRDPKLAPAYAERAGAAASPSPASALSPAVEQAVEDFYKVLSTYQAPATASSEDSFASLASCSNPCYMRNPRDFGNSDL